MGPDYGHVFGLQSTRFTLGILSLLNSIRFVERTCVTSYSMLFRYGLYDFELYILHPEE